MELDVPALCLHGLRNWQTLRRHPTLANRRQHYLLAQMVPLLHRHISLHLQRRQCRPDLCSMLAARGSVESGPRSRGQGDVLASHYSDKLCYISFRLNLGDFKAWNILTDLFLAALPATFLYNLNLSLKKKLGLCLLLGLGAAVAVFAAVKTKFLFSLNERADITWQTYDLYLWSGMELFVIIFCGSVPPVKPVYDHLFGISQASAANATGSGRHGSSSHYCTGGGFNSRPMPTATSSKLPDAEEVELSLSPVRSGAISTHSTTDSLYPPRHDLYSPH